MDLTIYLGLALSAFLAGSILPFSSEAALAAAVLHAPHNAIWLVTAASIGNIAGAALNWWLGRSIERFQERPWFPVSADSLARARNWFGRFGVCSLLFAWIPVFGDPLTVVAGFMRVRLCTFLILVGSGKIARYAFVASALS